MNAPVLVTGGNGFVGSHVVEALLEAGYKVRCLLRPHSRPQWIETLPVEIKRADFADPNELRTVLEGCQTVLHFGGATKAPDREAYLRANAFTSQALLEAAIHACPDLKLFLLCSSQAALGPSPSLDPLSEDAPQRPITDYGKSKLAAEEHCRQYEGRFPIVILRPPAVYGPRDRDVLIFFRTIRWGISPVMGKSERYFSLVHVLDVARITRMIVEKQTTDFRIYHVTDGAVHRWDEVAQAIARAVDKRPVRIRVPLGLAFGISKILSRWSALGGRMTTLNRDKLADILQQYWLISSRRVEEELGFKPEWDLEEGVEMTARWYKEHGWL